MVTATISKWQVTVVITRTLGYPIEDNENKEEFTEWAQSVKGRQHIQKDFVNHLNCYGVPAFWGKKNAEMEVEEVELKEYEVKSTDTNSSV